ncbi:TIGR03546 family protein [Bacterioplanes sanyensis]|uniref:TIGR03546 family protein n=1 Tax=Bacterioplanes sanyensis TaxID=1249553 RepID=A0A222FNJ3_9GAMM|nr:TIGR03546 family protein [Bacterioplanes sanyensis]ASP40319.1 TIGR03546 family protein [Bacterioplanes sanyensis]
MLNLLAQILKALNSESAPGQIALAVAFAFWVALTPMWTVNNLLILTIVLLLRVNLSAFFAALAGFSLLALLLDPLSDRLGAALLQMSSLQGVWTSLYQQGIWRVLQFNNTLMLGGTTIALLAFLPLSLLTRMLVVQYRARWLAWIRKLKIVQALKASKFYQWYQSAVG